MQNRTLCVLWIPAMISISLGCSRYHQAATAAKAPPPSPAAHKTTESKWTPLFDGKTLGNWKSTPFGGEGEVHIEDGAIVLPMGSSMTGVTWQGEPPARINYEIELEAMRAVGNDFFCGLTFPVNNDPCSLIIGGWGGTVVGLSSLDGNDAANNETTAYRSFEADRWYKVRLRVQPDRIQAWIDDEQVVNTQITGRKISIRAEVYLSKPLGIATWNTEGHIKNIRWRKL